MAKSKLHPQLEEAKVAAILFVALIFIIAFLALFVRSALEDPADAQPAKIERAIQKVGNLYPRQDS